MTEQQAPAKKAPAKKAPAKTTPAKTTPAKKAPAKKAPAKKAPAKVGPALAVVPPPQKAPAKTTPLAGATLASRAGTQVCRTCGQDKPMQQFPTTGKVIDGVMGRGTQCRACRDAGRESKGTRAERGPGMPD